MDIVLKWIKAFNAADIVGLEGLYAPDDVNHQMANMPGDGRSAIGLMFKDEIAKAEMHCIIENIFHAGECYP